MNGDRQENLRTKIAIGCRASYELCSNYLLTMNKNVYERILLRTTVAYWIGGLA